MRAPENAFHLAIPCRDLDEAEAFYGALGCRSGRRYDTHVTLDFFGDQVVCHLSPDAIESEPTMYPRHFGVNFRELESYLEFLAHCRSEGFPFFREPFVRREGQREEHRSFFLLDPSNNVLEFKHYADAQMML